MPDPTKPSSQTGEDKPKQTKSEFAGHVRSVNANAKDLTDDQIVEMAITKHPEVASSISDYTPPKTKYPAQAWTKPTKQTFTGSFLREGAVFNQPTDDFTKLNDEFQGAQISSAAASVFREKYNSSNKGWLRIPNEKNDAQTEYFKNTAEQKEKISNQDFQKFKVKYDESQDIQFLRNEAKSNVNNFVSKDDLGGIYIDQKRVRTYVRSKFPEIANTQFENFIVNNIKQDLDFESNKPKIEEKVQKIAKEKKIEIPANIFDINKTIIAGATELSNKTQAQLSNLSVSAQQQLSNLSNSYKESLKSLNETYDDIDYIPTHFNTPEEAKAAYKNDYNKLFNEYSRQYSSIRSNAISTSERLKKEYESSVNNLQINAQKDVEKISPLLKEAIIKVNEDANNQKLSLLRASSEVFGSGSPNVFKFGYALTSGVADWVNNIATNLSIPGDVFGGAAPEWITNLKDWSNGLSKKLSVPDVKINSTSEFLNPEKFVLSSGKMIGQMTPAIAASVGIARITGGQGLTPILASGTVAWADEASQAAASNYNAMIEAGALPEDAKSRSQKTYSGYLATLPLSMIGTASMFGKFGKGSMLRRLGANISGELVSETGQEIWQSEQDEAIVGNRKVDFGKMFSPKNIYTTALNVAPATIVMGAPGSIIESGKNNETISKTADWALRISTAPIMDMSKNIIQNGLAANLASIEAMRHDGVLPEEATETMKAYVTEVSSDMQAGKSSGLNKSQQAVYAGLMGNVRQMEQNVNDISSQELGETEKAKLLDEANKRLKNAREVASDFINTKNGNYAEVTDKNGNKYIVSHDILDEMLADESFQSDVKNGNARVNLKYNKNAGERLGDISKKLFSLNKNFNEGVSEYEQSDKALNALRKKLGIEEQPTPSTTIDGLIGQTVTYRSDKTESKINITGTLQVQNGQLVIEDNKGGLLRLGNAEEFNGVSPSFLNIEFKPQEYTGPKMTQEQAKLPSLLAMFAGKIDPKTLSNVLYNSISDISKAKLNKMIKAFDIAYQRKMQQKSINESLPKPDKLLKIQQPEVGAEYSGEDVASSIAEVGDKTSKTLLGKILNFVTKDFIATTIDLDDLHENSEEFRNRVEQEKGEKADRFKTEFSNTENSPAVLIDGKVEDGMGRLARQYISGQKTAIVFENIKTKENATTKSQGEIKKGGTESDIVERARAQAEQEQEANQADISNRDIRGKKIEVTPDIARITIENVNDVSSIPGNSVQKKVLNDVKNVLTALSGILNITVDVHSQESYREALLNLGVSEEDVISRGVYVGNDKTIHINMNMVKSDTMLHEGFHPLLDLLAENNPNFIKDIFNQLSSIKEAKQIIELSKSLYDKDVTQMKEAITDFIAGVADGRVVINPSNFEKVKSFVLNILSKLGLGEGMIVMNVEGKPELIKLANFVTEKFRGGEVISYSEIKDMLGNETVDPVNVSNISVVDPLQLSRVESNTSIFTPFKISWIPKGLKINKPKNTSRVYDVLVKSGGSVVVINSDATGIGFKNGVLRQGGIGYTFIEQNVNEKIGFAASVDSKQKSFYNAVKEAARVRDEKFPEMAGKPVAVFVMVQTPEAMFGNAYGVDFFIEAIEKSLSNKEITAEEASAELKNFFEIFKTSNEIGRKYSNSIDALINALGSVSLSTNEGRKTIYDLLISNRENAEDKSAKFGFDARRVIFSQFFNRIAKAKNKPGGKLRDSLDNDGYNHRSFFNKYGDENVMGSLSGETESQRLSDGNFAMTGFFVDPTMTSDEYLNASKSGTYTHKQFNGRFHGVDPFVLNGKLYVNNAFPEARFVDENGKYVPVQSSAAMSLYPRTRENPEAIIERSIDFQRVAPNGKPSNLNANQYEQVRTPEFKNWFGDWENDPANASKVVDENGEPLVVYHGSATSDIKIFDRLLSNRESSGLKEMGVYFTTNKNLAKLYAEAELSENTKNDIKKQIDTLDKELDKARNNREFENIISKKDVLQKKLYYNTGRIYETFLNLKNVKEFDAGGNSGLRAWDNLKVDAGYKTAQNRDAMDFLMNGKFGVEKVDGIIAKNITDLELYGWKGEQLKKDFIGTVYLVFDDNKNAIKSATDNSGAFSTTDNRIQFQKATPTKSKLQAIKNNPLFANLSDTQAERLAKGVTIWQQWATSYGLLGKEAKIAEEYKTGYVSQELYNADKAVKDVVKQLNKAKKDGVVITDGDITDYLTGVSIPQNITQDVMIALNKMRVHIDAMTEELILNGAITDQDEINEFRNNKGKYLGRFYDMFINGKGLTLNNIVDKLKNVDENTIERARTLIRSEIYAGVQNNNPSLTQNELNKVVDNLVDDILNSIVESTGNPYVKQPMKGSVNMKALMARQDIVEPIRALMGEITNPISRYYATIGKMASVAGGVRYLNEIRNIGMGNFLFEENDPNRPKGTVKISTESNKNLAPIAGLYTFREVRDEFNNYMMSNGKNNNILEKAIGVAKYSNTVGNIPTHVKNFASNIGILVNNGYIADIPNAIDFIINEPEAFKKAYDELRKSGTLNNNINATELRTYFEKNNSIDKVLSNKFKSSSYIKKATGLLTDIYNLEDDIFKVLSYMVESQRYAKAMYGIKFSELSNQEKDAVTKKSIDVVKSILPLFSRVPPFIKGMNKYLYLGSFMTFTAESIRISKNTLLLAIRELKDKNTASIGAKRLFGVITWNSAYGYTTTASAAGVGAMATGAFTYWINAMQQLTSDDDDNYKKKIQKEKDIRRVVRDYNISSDIFNQKASDGELVYYDIGSVNPYQFLTNFLNRFDQLSKDDGEGYAMDLLRSIGFSISPFVKTDFVAERFIKVYQSLGQDANAPKDQYGKDIYNQSDNAYEKAGKLSKYMMDVFTPGMVRNYFRYRESAKEGDVEGAKNEIISTLTVRKVKVDVNSWFYNKLKNGTSPYVHQIQEQVDEYNRVPDNASKEKFDEQYYKSLNKIRYIVSQIGKDYAAALNLGVDDRALIKSLQMSKMKDQNITAVIQSVGGNADQINDGLLLTKKH